MNNDVERFVTETLERFDQVEQTDVELFWEDLNNRKGRIKRAKRYTGFGATLLFSLILCGSLCFQLYQQQTEAQWIITNLEDIDPELSKYQQMIQQTIENQQDILETMDIDRNEHKDVYQSLDELDKITLKYKADLQEFGPQPRILKSLLKCAKQRVRLYELILFEIELKAYQDDLESRT